MAHPLRYSVRLPQYDYTQPGVYFITICTYERKMLLGRIENENMVPSLLGEIVDSFWKSIRDHFPNTELLPFIIMPNHLHGLIQIKEPVAARHAVPVQGNSDSALISEDFGKPVSRSLPTIIRSFKSVTTKEFNLLRNDHGSIWQRGYYEHTIRSDDELIRIGEYIQGNPSKWESDRENPGLENRPRPLPFEY